MRELSITITVINDSSTLRIARGASTPDRNINFISMEGGKRPRQRATIGFYNICRKSFARDNASLIERGENVE